MDEVQQYIEACEIEWELVEEKHGDEVAIESILE